jgi:hypothetical protein
MSEQQDGQASDWVGAQGERDGKAFLVRARRFAPGIAPLAAFPELLVIEVAYEPLDDTGLPGKFHYDNAEAFEQLVFDTLEEAQALIFVFSEIGDGKFRYFTYAAEPPRVIAYVRGRINPDLPVEFYSGADPEWSEYSRRLAALS